MKSVFGVLTILLMIVVASSCKKKKDASVIITVLKDSTNQITLDTSSVPAVLVGVRFYSTPLGSIIDTTIFTNTNGKAEFVWFEDAIIQYDVVFNSFTLLEEFVILKQGETVEETVNIDE